MGTRQWKAARISARGNPEEAAPLIVDGARVVGGWRVARLARAYLSTRSNSMPRATVSAANSAVIANAVRARILPRGVIDHPPRPRHVPDLRQLPRSSWREMSNSAAPGAPPGRMAAPSSYEGWAHAVKPTIESRLADAEAELAFLRADNGRVARENARLRGQCERLSAEVAMLSEDPEAHARQLRRGLMGARRRDGSDVDLASTAEAAPRASREDRQLSLFLTDGKGALTERRVPGIVSAPPGVLQFGVVQAEVTSTGFVGLRPLGTNDAVNTASTSTSSVSAKMKSLMAGVLGAAGGSARVADGARDEPTGAEPERADAPTRSSYEIVWKEGGGKDGGGKDGGGKDGGGQLRRLAFECDANGFEYVREQIRSWSESATVTDRHGSADGAAAADAAARHRRAGSNLTIDLHDGDAGDGDDGGDEGEVSEDEVSKPVKAAEGEEDVVARRPERRTEEAPAGDRVRSVRETTTTGSSPHVVRPKGPKFFPVVDGARNCADMSDESAVCDSSIAFALSRAFPARLRDSSWRLRYSTKRDGTSLRTMYRAAGSARVGEHRCEESVLLVRSSSGERFGAFTTEHWRVAPRYYGTGESFVFVLEGAGGSNTEVAGSNPAAGGGARVFPWTQRNNYFVFGRNECAAVGGGAGFALWLDEELARGNSARSDTFGNDPLSSEHEFDVACVELWTFE